MDGARRHTRLRGARAAQILLDHRAMCACLEFDLCTWAYINMDVVSAAPVGCDVRVRCSAYVGGKNAALGMACPLLLRSVMCGQGVWCI